MAASTHREARRLAAAARPRGRASQCLVVIQSTFFGAIFVNGLAPPRHSTSVLFCKETAGHTPVGVGVFVCLAKIRFHFFDYMTNFNIANSSSLTCSNITTRIFLKNTSRNCFVKGSCGSGFAFVYAPPPPLRRQFFNTCQIHNIERKECIH